MEGKRITNDEQYEQALKWLVDKAKLLDHPLLDPEKREQLMKMYDFVAERVREYRLNGPPAPQAVTADGEYSEAEEYTDWLDD